MHSSICCKLLRGEKKHHKYESTFRFTIEFYEIIMSVFLGVLTVFYGIMSVLFNMQQNS